MLKEGDWSHVQDTTMYVFVLQDGDQLRVRGAAGDGHLRNRGLCQEIES